MCWSSTASTRPAARSRRTGRRPTWRGWISGASTRPSARSRSTVPSRAMRCASRSSASRIGLGLDRQHPGLRPAGGPVQGTCAAYLEDVFEPQPARHVRRAGGGAAEAVLRHHRRRAGGGRPAFGGAAAPGRRQHGHPRSLDRHRAVPADRGRRARCSRSAIRTPRRATAKCAARRSKASTRRR